MKQNTQQNTQTNLYNVSATSMVSKTSPLVKKERLKPPVVMYSPLAWEKIQITVAMNPKEVGWFGTVEKRGDNLYYIKDIFIPEQTVTGTETDIKADALVDIACELENPEELIYWGHSHVNMGVSPSGQDERQTEEYLNHVDFFIRGIYNKSGVSKVDVFDVESGLVHECVLDIPYMPAMSDDELAAFKDLIKNNVKERVYPQQQNFNNRYPRTHTQQGGKGKGSTLYVAGSNRKSEVNPLVVGSKEA